MTHKHLPALLSLLFLCAVTSAQTPREQINAAEAAVGKAIHTNDFAALEKLWSPDMIVNAPGNHVLKRSDVFDAMRHEELHYSRYETTVDQFSSFGDVAVLMGHETVALAVGPLANQPLTRRFTDVWQHTPAGWVQIARQATYTAEAGPVPDVKLLYSHPKP